MKSEIEVLETELKVYNELNVQLRDQTTEFLAKPNNREMCTPVVQEAEKESNEGAASFFTENGVC